MEKATFNGYTRIDSWLRYLPKTEGVVTGVYRNSYAVKAMDFLLSFVAHEDALHPLGVLVPEKLLQYVRKDQKVQFCFPQVIFADHQIQVEPRHFPLGDKSPISGVLRENTARIFSVLNNFGRCSDVSEAYVKKKPNTYLKPIVYLCMLMKKEKKLNLEVALSLIGAGQGLTPAWDDFCAGMLLTDRFWQNGFIATYPSFFQEIRQRSTFSSYWQMKFAEVGKFSLIYERFLNKLQHGKVSSTEVVKCLNFGHSSGTDILSGIHAYLQNVILVG